MGLYVFYAKRLPADRKFYDRIPPLAEKKYLKTIYECYNKCTLCFNDSSPEGKQPDVLMLDEILGKLGHLLP